MADAARIDASGDGRFAVSGLLTFETARRSCEAGIAAFKNVAAAGGGAASGAGSLVVDCGGVAGADSAGMAVLIEWRRWARKAGRSLSYANLPAAIVGMARICGVEGVLGVEG